MNIFNIFGLHAVYITGAVICFLLAVFPVSMLAGVSSVAVFHRASRHRDKQMEPLKVMGLNKNQMMKVFFILGISIIFFLYTYVFVFFTYGWLRAEPTTSWKNEINTVDTAIILAFAYEEDDDGRMTAGKSNEFLLEWTLKYTKAETILVQEGVWVAACKQSEKKCEKFGRRFIRIHCHDPNIYVNTYDAAYCSLQKMVELGKKKAIIIAHDLQLQRSAWIFEKLKKACSSWQDFEFIIPRIPDTPFPENSAQLHTSWAFLYKLGELFWSRPRDFLGSIPKECIAPSFP